MQRYPARPVRLLRCVSGRCDPRFVTHDAFCAPGIDDRLREPVHLLDLLRRPIVRPSALQGRELLRQDPSLANRLGGYEGGYPGAGAPIANAAAAGRLDIARLLLDHGADSNLPEEQIAPRGKALNEDTPMNPSSRKGEIQAKARQRLFDAHRRSDVVATTGAHGFLWTGRHADRPRRLLLVDAIHTYHYIHDGNTLKDSTVRR